MIFYLQIEHSKVTSKQKEFDTLLLLKLVSGKFFGRQVCSCFHEHKKIFCVCLYLYSAHQSLSPFQTHPSVKLSRLKVSLATNLISCFNLAYLSNICIFVFYIFNLWSYSRCRLHFSFLCHDCNFLNHFCFFQTFEFSIHLPFSLSTCLFFLLVFYLVFVVRRMHTTL